MNYLYGHTMVVFDYLVQCTVSLYKSNQQTIVHVASFPALRHFSVARRTQRAWYLFSRV